MGDDKKVTIKQNLIEAYKIVYADFKEHLSLTNERWYGTIRLLITLSTSILLASIALIDKIFPLASSPLHIKNTLIIGWVLLFISIIFGILTELKGAEFSGLAAREREKILKQYLEKIAENYIQDQQIDLGQDFIRYPSLFYGFSTIATFILAVLCIAIYSIGNIIEVTLICELLIVGIIGVIMIRLILNYFKNRK